MWFKSARVYTGDFSDLEGIFKDDAEIEAAVQSVPFRPCQGGEKASAGFAPLFPDTGAYSFKTAGGVFLRVLEEAKLLPSSVVMSQLSEIVSKKEAEAILDDFRPDLVVGTGGYASYPVVSAAAKRGIPTAVHEANAVPGLTTKRLSKVADRVLVGYEEARENYSDPDKVVVTGTPVRLEFFQTGRHQARDALGVKDDRPVLLSYWGSLGADVMNERMVDFIRREAADGAPWVHIHGAGRNYDEMKVALADTALPENIQLREYIYDMPQVMLAADLVLCRGGASTLSELTAIGKPAVIVPSPNVTNHHQEKNANVLANQGGAVVLLEPVCSGQVLYQTVQGLLADVPRLNAMSLSMGAMGIPDAAEKIYRALVELLPEDIRPELPAEITRGMPT